MADFIGICISFEDRQDLLGHIPDHRSVTRLYSAANLSKLIEAANKVCKRDSFGSVLNLIRGNAWGNKASEQNPHKIPTLTKGEKKKQSPLEAVTA